MTRDEALLALYRAPERTLKYFGSGFGNPLTARLSRAALIELKNEWGRECTMKLTAMGAILAEEVLRGER